MKTNLCLSPRPPRGFALILVMVLAACSLMMLAGSLNWVSTSVRLTERDNRYTQAQYAAEAAAAKVLTRMNVDFQAGGEASVYGNLANYRTNIPTAAEDSYWSQFEFNNATGTVNQVFVQRASGTNSTNVSITLNARWAGLYGIASNYRVVSNVKVTNGYVKPMAAVQQDIALATIPLFQFAIFYNSYLDLNPGATMNVRGRVHSNGSIWTGAGATLSFFGQVSASGVNTATREPHDPGYSSSPVNTVSYSAPFTTNQPQMILPIGTNNTSAAVHQVIEIPPTAEDPASNMGTQRYYNKALLQVIVTNSAVKVTLISPTNSSVTTNISWAINAADTNGPLCTNLNFQDMRESKNIMVTQFDLAKYKRWANTNTAISNWYGTNPPNIIFIADMRTNKSTQLDGVRITGGKTNLLGGTLPSGGAMQSGMTLATPNPLYVLGDFNCPVDADRGTTNTSHTVPCSLVSDAMTCLSANWADGTNISASTTFSTRAAVDQTINAAIMTGNVPWTNGMANYYSGGANNLPRLLEDWAPSAGTRTLTLNTSLICMYSSTKAVGHFQQSGSYYDIPNRNFNFDLNFADPTKPAPPGTPFIRAVIRQQWTVPPPSNTVYAGY